MALLRPAGTNEGYSSIFGLDMTSATPSIVRSRPLHCDNPEDLVAIGDAKFSDIKWTIMLRLPDTIHLWRSRLAGASFLRCRGLPRFEFIYIAPGARLFQAAESEFHRLLYGRRDPSKPASILDYFRLRRAWDTKERVASADVVLLKGAQQHFAGSRVENLYGEWRQGVVGNEDVTGNTDHSTESTEPRKTALRTLVRGASLKAFSNPLGRRRGKLDGKGHCARSRPGFGTVVQSGFRIMRSEVMPVQERAAITNILEYAAQGCFEGERSSRSDFGLDLRPVFRLPQIEAEEKRQHTGDGAFGEERGENRFLGGSDPTLSGLAAARRLRRRGSLPPKWSNRLPRSVAGRVVGDAAAGIERAQA
jgi:hypothetical protein